VKQNKRHQHHNSNDLEALQKDSHRILGAAQMFALDDIAKAAKNLDMALLNKQSQSKEHIQKLVDELQRVLKKYNES